MLISICRMLSVAIETGVDIGKHAEGILEAYTGTEKVTGISGVHEQCSAEMSFIPITNAKTMFM